MKWIFVRLAIALLAVLVAGQEVSAKSKDAAAPQASAAARGIDGFRSARFGMTETEVRDAIAKDFAVKGDGVATSRHPSEMTTLLVVRVNDLLPNTGPATVTYTLGVQSKKLIQVGIAWTAEGERPDDIGGVVATANALRDYFAGQELVPESVVMNQNAKDGSVLVFRGEDKAGHLVMVSLVAEKTDKDRKDGDKADKKDRKDADKGPAYRAGLIVRYVENFKAPDILKIKPGSF